jgi:glyceraldehyde 3-phosphate dehydrogenase
MASKDIITIHSIRQIKVYMINHKDLRRARGASQSIVPTTTDSEGINKNFSYIRRENRWLCIRVPVADGSLTDITFNVNRAVTIDEINEAFRYAASII